MSSQSKCTAAEATGLIVIAVIMLALVLLRYGDRIAWSAR
jgi:hypothetical protein